MKAVQLFASSIAAESWIGSKFICALVFEGCDADRRRSSIICSASKHPGRNLTRGGAAAAVPRRWRAAESR